MSSVLDEVVEGFEPSPELVSVMAATKPAAILGLDIGTSGVRAALFDDDGREIEGASVRLHRPLLDSGDLARMDADETVALVAQSIDALLAQPYHSSTQVVAIAVSCFWHSLVGVDRNGAATTPVLGWATIQASEAALRLRSRLDETEFHLRTGCRFHPSYWPAKLLWLREEKPETFNRTSLWLSFGEYLTMKLFGETATSVSMASGTGLFNQTRCEWDDKLLEAINIEVEHLPEIAAPDQTFHTLTDGYALRWPQLINARFYPAIADGAANSIGSGCTSRENLALMIGTSGAMRLLYRGDPPNELRPELWCYRADRKRVLVGGALSDGGGLHRWLRESLLQGADLEVLESALENLGPDEHGLTILPFWAGERSTGWSVNARGGILGLTLQTQPIEILRAAMEAVAYRFALIAKALEPLAPGASIIVSGNALRSSPVWMQIIADVLGQRISVSGSREASTRGAALLALEAAGKIQSIEELPVSIESTFEPDMSRHARYQQGLERQQKIYERLMNEQS